MATARGTMAETARHIQTPENIVWKAQLRQAHALSCPAFELFYGGAKYGGKTDFLLADFAQDVNTWGRAWKGIIFRRTYNELEEIIARSLELYPYVFPGAKYGATSKTWYFPSGARLKLRFIDQIKDIHHYHGHSYSFAGWDELPRWNDLELYLEFMSMIRSPAGAPCRVRATGNPGGPAHLHVKQRFIDVAAPLRIYRDPETGLTRVFVPARLEDNPQGTMRDPAYEARMKLLPPHLYKMYREGRWDVVAGSVFGEIWNPAAHVMKPFRIPKAWRKFRALDWGSSRPFSVGWYAVDTEGRLFRYRELYGWGGKPNVGLKWDSRTLAREILAREKGAFDEGQVDAGPADPSVWNKQDGPSVAEKMAEEGVSWIRADNDRLNGWQEVMARLRWSEPLPGRPAASERPGLVIFENCVHLIRTLPVLTYDETHPEDIDTDQEEHAADELRYACMSRPWRTYTVPEIARFKEMQEFKPLDPFAGY